MMSPNTTSCSRTGKADSSCRRRDIVIGLTPSTMDARTGEGRGQVVRDARRDRAGARQPAAGSVHASQGAPSR